MILPLGLYGCVVLALLVAELREDKRAQYFFKPLAALGFILLALMCGALETIYGQIILTGLVACALGDALLLARQSKTLFLLGMAAFAAGHILYITAFFKLGFGGQISGNVMAPSLLLPVIGICGVLILLSKTKPRDWAPMAVYSLIIIAMLGTAGLTGNYYVIAGALLFAVSDFFVGMDRFIKPERMLAFGITPLYFGAQALFALSVQM